MDISCYLNGLDKEGYRTLMAKLAYKATNDAANSIFPLIDRNDDGDVSFLRRYIMDSAGNISSFVDTELDGVTPYTVTGTVVAFPRGGGGGGSFGPFIATEDDYLFQREGE